MERNQPEPVWGISRQTVEWMAGRQLRDDEVTALRSAIATSDVNAVIEASVAAVVGELRFADPDSIDGCDPDELILAFLADQGLDSIDAFMEATSYIRTPDGWSDGIYPVDARQTVLDRLRHGDWRPAPEIAERLRHNMAMRSGIPDPKSAEIAGATHS